MVEKYGNSHPPIAIIGIGCRFPGAGETPAEFWQMLLDKKDGVKPIPPDRWDAEAFYHPDYNTRGKMQVKEGGFVDDIDRFDAQFFGIAPVEAQRMDPQQRLLLEHTYYAFEDAGLTLDQMSSSRTGVFVGISSIDYAGIQNSSHSRANIGPQTNTGGAASIAANRISYVFDLLGPSFAVDTACSSGLVATHNACRSIWNNDAEMAVVGGVNLLLSPEFHIGFSTGGFLAPDCRCKTFDASADGYVRSEGCGVVILKPLDRAIADGDRIYATVIGSALNEDGHTGGISMPNPDAQIDVLEKAYNDAGIDPKSVDYIEAHGTGTAVGDPIECNSIVSVLGGRKQLLIGSVKSNIGHLEPASGLAGMIKTALILKNRKVPANLHFKNPNPAINFEGLKIKIPTNTSELRKKGKSLTAGINSFGFGGANAHVVMQSFQPQNKKLKKPENTAYPLLISARSEQALQELAKAYKKMVKNPEIDLADLCYSVATRRSALEIRAAVPCQDRRNTAKLLDQLSKGKEHFLISRGRKDEKGTGKTAFVFSGQGPQWFAMGREMIKENKIFLEAVSEVDKILKKLGWLKKEKSSLLDELQKTAKTSRMHETEIAQPAIFAIQVALTRVWESMGITPEGIIGHSIGEVAAAWAAGALELKEATRIVYWRSRCQAAAAGRGKMLAVGMSKEQAEEKLKSTGGDIEIAAVNGPEMLTLAGKTEALENLSQQLEEENIFYRFLIVDVPFHSFILDDIIDDFKNSLKNVKNKNNDIQLYSTVTGKLIKGKSLTSNYWAKNIRQPVLFYPTIREMVRDGYRNFVEISPHPILGHGLQAALDQDGFFGLVLGSLRRKEPEMSYLLSNVGKLFCHGFEINFKKMFAGDLNFIELPHYPWQRDVYWLETPKARKLRLGTRIHPHLTGKVWNPEDNGSVVWNLELDHRTHPYIEDHRVQGPLVYPGAGHVDLALGVARASFGDDFGFLEDLQFKEPLFLPDDGEPYPGQISVTSDQGDYVISTSRGLDSPDWTIHSRGRINHIGDTFKHCGVDLKKLQQRIKNPVKLAPLFEFLAKGGLFLGPAFKGLTELWQAEGEALGRIELPENIRHDFSQYNIHPALLDASFQTAFGIIANTDFEGVYIPIKINRLKFYQSPESTIFSYAKAASYSDDIISADIWIMDSKGDLLLEIQGFTAKYLKGSRGEVAGQLDNFCYSVEWQNKDRWDQITHRHPREYMPRPAELSEPMEKVLDSIMKDKRFNEFLLDMSPAMEDLALRYMVDALLALGVDFSKINSFNARSLGKKLKIVKGHWHLWERILKHLSSKGVLKQENGQYSLVDKDLAGAKAKMMQVLEELPQFTVELNLLKLCGENLPAILQGRIDPLQLLFSPENRSLLTAYYSDAYTFTKYHKLIAAAVKAIVADLPEYQTLRVLEIGAGTGGITKMILPLFPADRTEYFFTDISFEFMQAASQRFGEYPFVHFQALDITKDIEKQNLEPGSFDLVIASNVVHSTPDVKHSLTNIQRLLADGGSLVMLEVTQTSIYPDLIFGLTEGWWNFLKDPLQREDCSLNSEQWLKVFSQSGFADSWAITDILERNDQYPRQHVFITRANNKDHSLEKQEKITPGRWLMIPDQSGMAEKLRRKMIKQGHQVDVLKLSQIADFVPPKSDELPFCGVLYFAGIDFPELTELNDWELKQCLKDYAFSLVEIVCTLDKASSAKPLGLWLVTAGATQSDKGPLALQQTPLIGLGRVIFNEFRSLDTHIVDVSTNFPLNELNQLLDEINAEPGELSEEEIAFRGRKRLVRRINRSNKKQMEKNSLKQLPACGGEYHLTMGEAGLFEDLKLRQFPLNEPQPDEITIEVKAASLNFRDVMLATGSLPEPAIKDGLFGSDFGLECSGIITKLGSQVNGVKIGDKVMAIARNCFAGKVNAKAGFAVKIPRSISLQKAAGLPMAYLTAYYSLVKIAGLQHGEKVLIHAAAGGVGIAAVNIARKLGAEIYATASKEKHAFLRECGIKHIYDSRSPEFYDCIMRDTQGVGVDVVLNSLSGPLLTQSLKSLAPGGRFIEIGKKDLYQNKWIGLELLADNSSYAVVDIDRLLVQKPQLMQQCLQDIFVSKSKIYSDKCKSVQHPLTIENIANFASALRTMAQGKHLGKIILEMTRKIMVAPSMNLQLDPKGSYLVAGGTSGFGLVVGKFLAKRGAGKIVLASRSGKVRPEDEYLLKVIKAAGTKLSILKMDVSKRSQVKRVIQRINSGEYPLKGVFQSSMVLADSFLKEMDWEKFDVPLEAKIQGTWNLHLATLGLPLDYFICFSSIASIYGTPGQANYAAANSFIDNFPLFRHALGLPAQTINWGAIADMGYVARTQEIKDFLGNHGWRQVSLANALTALEQTMLQDEKQVGFFDVDWLAFAQTFPQNAKSGRIAHLHFDANRNVKEQTDGSSFADKLRACPPSEREALALDVLRSLLARIIGLNKDKIDVKTPITRMGIDSLMANQIRSWLTQQSGISFSLMQIMQGPTPVELAETILQNFKTSGPQEAQNAASPWLLVPKPVDNPKFRLFCFPYMGVGASIYNGWQEQLPAEVEIQAVQFPGREERIEESPISDTSILFPKLAEAMLPLLDKPFFFYGHSFGGNMAMNFAAYLKEVHQKIPLHLYIGAAIPEKVENPLEKEFSQARSENKQNDADDDLIKLLEILGTPANVLQDKQALQKILPAVRGDLALSRQGDRYRDVVIPCPITAFAGIKDHIYTADMINEWQSHTKDFSLVKLPGTHLFIHEEKCLKQVMSNIINTLK